MEPGTWVQAPPLSLTSSLCDPIHVVPEITLTGTVTQSVHDPPLSRTWMRYVATSSDSRCHWTRKLGEVCHRGRGLVDVNGGSVSTIVHVSFPAGGSSTFPA